MSQKIHTSDTTSSLVSTKTDVCPHRPVPLSTRQILISMVSLSLFSFLYLGYAQKHAVLFYVMTGIVAIYILFVYTSGIAAVLYMVAFDYDLGDSEKSQNNERDVEESTM